MKWSLTVVLLLSPLAMGQVGFVEPAEPPPAALDTYQVDGFDDPADVAVRLAEELTRYPAGLPRQRMLQRIPLSAEQLAERQAGGRLDGVDVARSELTVEHIVDVLPADWQLGAPPGAKVDSYGNPIVNETPGLPDWAQRDIDDLRTTIASMLEERERLVGSTRRELDSVLGSHIAHALVRRIAIDDLVVLHDRSRVSDEVARAIISGLQFYEAQRLLHSGDETYVYTPTEHSADVLDFVVSRGVAPETLYHVAIEESRTTPSGCYTKSTFARGLTPLAAPTILWETDGTDDAAADISLGFPRFYFYSCEDANASTQVRVSTNGYISFFQRGGGALLGTDWTNDPITSTIDPDGYIAGNWDDLIVMVAQGTNDKISYKTEGSVGSRVLTVEWYSISRRGGETPPDSSTDYHFFQIKLFESNNNVEIHIGQVGVHWNADTADDATIGMENYSGADGDCGPDCTNTINDEVTSIPNNYRFAPVRPLGDSCNAPICLEPGVVVSGTTLGASYSGFGTASCGTGTDVHDVWFRYYAPVSGNVTFSTCSLAGFDTVLSIYDACGGTELACNDQFCGNQSQFTVALVAGTEYRVRLAGWNGQQGSYELLATPATEANGDTCTNCWNLNNYPLGFNGYTTNNSGCSNLSTCGGSNDLIDEWFCYTAPGSGTVTITTCDDYTNFDTVLAAYTGTCSNLTQIACSDDDLFCGVNSNFTSLTFNTLGGESYYVRVSGFGNAIGNYRLEVLEDNLDPYCPAYGNCTSTYEYIANVTIGSINNNSGCGQWSNFTSLSTDVAIGRNYTLTITLGNPYIADDGAVWVDWNNDLDFDDPGETITTSLTGIGPYVVTITPPAGATLGPVRMRIRLDYNKTPTTIFPCGETAWGEVEDYTLNVFDACLSDVHRPTASITTPTDFQCVCGVVNIVGTATDPDGNYAYHQVSVYPVNNPAAVVTVNVTGAVINGSLVPGGWNFGSSDGYYMLNLTVFDSCGKSSFFQRLVHIDSGPGASISYPTNDPNNPLVIGGTVCIDGSAYDGVCPMTGYTVDYRAIGGSWLPVNPGTPVYPGSVINNTLATWNTSAVVDGNYQLRVVGSTACGSTTSTLVPVIVDNTLPTSEITLPSNCAVFAPGSIITVRGTAADAHLASWVLYYSGGTGHQLTTLASGSANVLNGVLASWNTTGLPACSYVLLLRVTDNSRVGCTGASRYQRDYYTTVRLGTPDPAPCCPGDIDGDGDVDFDDIDPFVGTLGVPCPTAGW